ncbi:Rs-rich protein-1 [Plakobranchus ocellatus]|uniref:Rs-rich protein-1 n=1 Tax=Plakobranchus ocellatus TaxID=259542 RepID=A0AAV4AGF4_9GAST|nr:Rs-rich protein-1 [Plakobranchus ocellatus]
MELAFMLRKMWSVSGTRGRRYSSVPPSHIMPMRRQAPVMVVPRHQTYSSPRHDYAIDESLHRADFLSHAVLEDTYDAAARSRGKDQDLLRNVNSAIRPSRDSLPSHRHRYHTITTPAKRFHSLPPTDHHYSSIGSKTSLSPSTGAIMPYRRPLRKPSSSYLDDLPSPTSLLSSKISRFLKGSSVPPRPLSGSVASNISYKSSLSHLPSDDMRSHISYSNYLQDPAMTRLLAKPSSSSHNSESSLLSKYRALSSPYESRASTGRDYSYLDGSEGDEDEEDGYASYKRKYHVVKGATTPHSDDEDYENEEDYEPYGTYSCPRPSNTPLLKLSSYDGEYDGSYDADMAEMYDYVPFGPSKHGIFELTHFERDHDSYADDKPSHSTIPYLPPVPSVTPMSSDVSPVTSVTLPSPVIDSLVSSTAVKFRRILQDSKSTLPDYKDASLVLSVEGSAVSDDGKNRYGFRYYPPPIPLKGGGASLGLDERILGIVPPSSGTSSADSFLTGYLNRLRNIRAEARDHVERGDYARGRSLPPLTEPSTYLSRYSPPPHSPYQYTDRHTSPYTYTSPPSVSLATLSPYTHSTIHVPVHLAGRATSVPVSSYRSRAQDGLSHRVDVYPLVESEARLPRDRQLQLPLASRGGAGIAPDKLTMLEKINIKVSTEVHTTPKSAVVSRRVRASTAPPAPRPPPGYQAHAQKIKVAMVRRSGPVLVAPATRSASPAVYLPPSDDPTPRPAPYYYVYVPPADLARPINTKYPSSSLANPNTPASKPVVLQQEAVDKTPWYIERAARARSVALEPPASSRAARGASLPPSSSHHHKKVPPLTLPPEPLPTSRMKASRRMPPAYEAAMLRARARSLDRGGTLGAGAAKPAPHGGPATQQLWAHRPVQLRKDAVLAARARADPRNPYSGQMRRAASEPRLLERGENSHHSYYYPTLPASQKFYQRVPDAREKAMQRHLYSHRGRFGPESKPPRPSLAGFPQVYVPWTGPGPSNRAKAAIIGSKMEPEGKASKRGPKSQFAQKKLRDMKFDDLQDSGSVRYTSMCRWILKLAILDAVNRFQIKPTMFFQESVFARTPSSGMLHASRPPLPKPTDRKSIRDVDGFTKPKNVMSWEHRVESRLSPDDIIYEPASLLRMRERVKDVQEKMDRQRQLLDRYLDKELPPTISSRTYGKQIIKKIILTMSRLWRYGRLTSQSPEPRSYARATSLPPASLPPRYMRSTSIAPASPAIYYREMSMPPARRASLFSRESSVASHSHETWRAASLPPVAPVLPAPRSYLLAGGYTSSPRPYIRSAYRPVTSSRAARLVVLPNRPVIRPMSRKRKHYRKIRIVKHPAREVVVDCLPPIPHLKQWSLSPRTLARPSTPTTRREGGNQSTVGADPENRPMSDLRRRLRRTLAKSKNNPDYYQE